MHRKVLSLLISVLFGLSSSLLGQNIEPNGLFLKSEIKIGEEVIFSLSTTYDKSLNVLFPDSSYDYGTFEYNSRAYFPTKSSNSQSFDSVVYHLSTFEIDSVQYLQLPIFALNDEDSLIYLSNIDSIRLIHVVQEIPENMELKANTELVNIPKQFNYPYYLIALGLLFIIALVIVLFFGKQLSRAWKVYRLKKGHQRFVKRFFNLMRDGSSNNPSKTPEQVLAFWKRYLEKLEKKPISKLTTKEILVLHGNGQLKENLRTIDRSIYGGEKGSDLFASFDYLMKFSIEIYNQKIEEIKNS